MAIRIQYIVTSSSSSWSRQITTGKLDTGNRELETRSGFLDWTDLAALVVAAMRTNLVRRLRFTALRTGANRHRLQRVVRAPLGRARVGMAAFGIRHV